MCGEFPRVYNSEDVEAGWFQWWESTGIHSPGKEEKEGGAFSMVLPPPNITGDLHLGHALTVTIQDTLARWSVLLFRESRGRGCTGDIFHARLVPPTRLTSGLQYVAERYGCTSI